MKKFEGFKSEAAPKREILPADVYVGAIQNDKIDGMEPDQTLILRIEIIEGPYAGYFTKRYHDDSQSAGFNQKYTAKYKGDFRLRIPNPNNPKSQHPDWDARNFNNAMYAIEHSNPGITFDWDKIFEGDFAFLKGKTVGINVREGTFNGNPYTTIGRLEVADDVRNGAVKAMPPMKPRGEAQVGQTDSNGFTPVEVDGLPF